MFSSSEGKKVSILLLDGSTVSIFVRPKLVASELLDLVCSQLMLQDRRCFGLCFQQQQQQSSLSSTASNNLCWLPRPLRVLDCEACKRSDAPVLEFRVKHFPPSLVELSDRRLSELFYLQCRQLIYNDDLLCDSDAQVFQLAALVLLAEHGDFVNNTTAIADLRQHCLFPVSLLQRHPSLEYCEQQTVVAYLQLSNSGQRSREDAIRAYLRLASGLPNFGQSQYSVTDSSGLPWWLGFSHRGVSVYDYNDRRHYRCCYSWSSLENIYCRDRKFTIDVRCDRKAPLSRWSFGKGDRIASRCWFADSAQTARRIFDFATSQHEFLIKFDDQSVDFYAEAVKGCGSAGRRASEDRVSLASATASPSNIELPVVVTPPDNALATATFHSGSSSAGGRSLRDLKTSQHPALYNSSQSVNRLPAQLPSILTDPSDDCCSLSQQSVGSSTSSDLLQQSAVIKAATSRHLRQQQHARHLCQLTIGSGGSSGNTLRPLRKLSSGERRRLLERYRELRSLLAELRTRKAEREEELARLIAQEKALANNSQSSLVDSGGAIGNRGDSPADPNTEDTRCLPTQYLVAVATNQHEDKQQQCSETESQLQQQLEQLQQELAVHKALVEASTRLLREAKESRQPRQLKKKRIAECQLAKERMSQISKKIQEVRDALCFAAEDAAAAASADGANVNEGVTAASVAVDFAIGSSFNSLSSGSSPRSVAADNTATSQDEQCLSVSASQNSSLLSLGAAASTARIAATSEQQPPHQQQQQQRLQQPALQRIQQQQQLGSVKNRVTQCSMDSGYQDTVCSSLTSLQQQHQHQPTPVPPFAVAVRESVAAASRTKQRRRSSSVGDLSKELEKFELQLQQLQEHMPAKDCSIVIDEPVESQRARAVTVEQCGPAQNTNFPSSGLASPDTLSEYRYRPREALEYVQIKDS
ncbi:hypothetical protein BOX15_Mlig013965g1 [Macrostomum lignano]|uniref:FERM domain-containing protein n=1 Tax=Macrostomum lignano TaxID=282301 RepID=A0A267G6N7_9PLAT|nr:hypothetical protein BOX15_Mlig013965g1 [Macrostomum lignano]